MITLAMHGMNGSVMLALEILYESSIARVKIKAPEEPNNVSCLLINLFIDRQLLL